MNETNTEAGGISVKAAPPLPEQMTLREFKKLRGKYFTVRHKRMDPCGHRLDQINEPRNNCEFCWFAFFQTHGELVQTVDRAVNEQGLAFIDRMRGIKFRKMFLRFMSTMAMFQKEFEKANACPECGRFDKHESGVKMHEEGCQIGCGEEEERRNGQGRKDQSSIGVGEGAGQEVRKQGDADINGQESGPVTANLPDPITLI